MISHMSSYSVLAQNISKGEIDFLVNFLDRVAFMILSVKKKMIGLPLKCFLKMILI